MHCYVNVMETLSALLFIMFRHRFLQKWGKCRKAGKWEKGVSISFLKPASAAHF